MRRTKGWLTVAAVSVTSNLAFFAVARKFPNGPVGRLKSLIINNSKGPGN